jgi:hypothetical protein
MVIFPVGFMQISPILIFLRNKVKVGTDCLDVNCRILIGLGFGGNACKVRRLSSLSHGITHCRASVVSDMHISYERLSAFIVLNLNLFICELCAIVADE